VRFADWMAGLPEGGGDEFVEIVAYHLEQACLLALDVGRTEVPPPVERAARELRRAGAKAERRGGIREAHGFYVRALALEPRDPALEIELRLCRARALVELGDHQQAAAELEIVARDAGAIGEDGLRCDAILTLGTIAMKQGRADDGRILVADAEELATQLGDSRLAIRAAFERAWWDAWFTGEVDAPVERLERAVELARLEGELTLRIGGLLRLGMALVNVARLGEAEEHLTQCAELAGELGSVRDAARATHILGVIKYYRGDVEAAEELLLQAGEWLERTGDGLFEIQNVRALALHARTTGRPELAESRLRAVLPLATEFGGYFAIEVARLLVECLLRGGKVDEARALAGPAIAAAPDEDATARAAARLTSGAIAAAEGDRAAMSDAFDDAISALEGIQAWLDVGEAHLAYADALATMGDDVGARRHLSRTNEIFASIGAKGHAAVALARADALSTAT
jgi:tetratricopeptide (TPR) repeat protein